jgi:hypothetical protein
MKLAHIEAAIRDCPDGAKADVWRDHFSNRTRLATLAFLVSILTMRGVSGCAMQRRSATGCAEIHTLCGELRRRA